MPPSLQGIEVPAGLAACRGMSAAREGRANSLKHCTAGARVARAACAESIGPGRLALVAQQVLFVALAIGEEAAT